MTIPSNVRPHVPRGAPANKRVFGRIGISDPRSFVLRTPLLPFCELTSWSEGLEAPAARDDPARLAAALAADRSLLRTRLAARLGRPEVREAVFLASPGLDASLEVWRRDPEGERGQRVERALVRYLARMAARATPFGIFAGCSVGTIGTDTRLAVTGRADARRHTQLDSDFLSALTGALTSDAALRGTFTYRPNSSLYRAAGRLRYVEARLDGARRSYHLVAVEPTEALEDTLARARDGASFETLAAGLVDAEVGRSEAESTSVS